MLGAYSRAIARPPFGERLVDEGRIEPHVPKEASEFIYILYIRLEQNSLARHSLSQRQPSFVGEALVLLGGVHTDEANPLALAIDRDDERIAIVDVGHHALYPVRTLDCWGLRHLIGWRPEIGRRWGIGEVIRSGGGT